LRSTYSVCRSERSVSTSSGRGDGEDRKTTSTPAPEAASSGRPGEANLFPRLRSLARVTAIRAAQLKRWPRRQVDAGAPLSRRMMEVLSPKHFREAQYREHRRTLLRDLEHRFGKSSDFLDREQHRDHRTHEPGSLPDELDAPEQGMQSLLEQWGNPPWPGAIPRGIAIGVIPASPSMPGGVDALWRARAAVRALIGVDELASVGELAKKGRAPRAKADAAAPTAPEQPSAMERFLALGAAHDLCPLRLGEIVRQVRERGFAVHVGCSVDGGARTLRPASPATRVPSGSVRAQQHFQRERPSSRAPATCAQSSASSGAAADTLPPWPGAVAHTVGLSVGREGLGYELLLRAVSRDIAGWGAVRRALSSVAEMLRARAGARDCAAPPAPPAASGHALHVAGALWSLCAPAPAAPRAPESQACPAPPPGPARGVQRWRREILGIRNLCMHKPARV
jgi:hypothetical protein